MAEPEDASVFPECRLEDWLEAAFQLTWHQHGGSGLAFSYEALLELPVAERNWWLARVAEQREREAEAIAQAARG